MFEFNYSKQIQFNVEYCRQNRHGTHIFNLRVKAEGCKGCVWGKIHLNKHQEIQIDVYSRNVFGVVEESNSLGIFKEDITKKLSTQITVQELTKMIK